ncbi:LexA family protein [Chloroflexota bacterium]
MTISARQKEVLGFIGQYVECRGYPPSIRDIAKGCGMSSSSVAMYHLIVLEQRNYLRRDPKISRSIVIKAPSLT